MIPVKRLLPVTSALLLLGLSMLLVSPSHPLVPSVRGSNRTISLIGYYPSGWNGSQPSGSNPTITVSQGDTINMQLSAGDNLPHKFLVDFDTDSNPTDTTDCPATDPCSPGTFSTSTVIPYSFIVSSTITPGTYKYICVIHYPYMVGNFVVVSAPASQDFTITSSPSSLNVTQGSSASTTITLTSLNGFSAVLSLTGTISPSGPSVSFNPTSVSLVAGGSGTSTMTVSAVAGYYSSVATGNYLVNVTATNGSLPHSKTVPVAVTSPTSTTPSPSGVGSLPATILIGAGAALVAVVGVVVYLVRRKPVAG